MLRYLLTSESGGNMSDPNTGVPAGTVIFAVIVDGDIAWMHGFPATIEAAVAAFSSDPKIVVAPPEVVAQMTTDGSIDYRGWTYSDGVFSPPSA
jgi:hypothetical protein